MGILIEIMQYFQKDSIFYYKVTEDFEKGGIFYISIDNNQKKLKFYRSAECKDTIAEIDLDNLHSEIKYFEGPSKKAIQVVVVKAYKAFRDNEFPDCLDYAA